MALKPKMNPEDLLKAEYDYIASTAFQANEDRARGASFYFVSVGSLVAAILGTQLSQDNLQGVALPLFILFAVMTGLGALTLAQLARLRAAWHESVEAMNVLKDFYLEHYPEFAPAFKWRMKSVPPTDKPYSIANLTAVEVTLLGGLTASAAVYFLLLGLGMVNWLGLLGVAVSAVLGAAVLWAFYKKLLVDNQ